MLSGICSPPTHFPASRVLRIKNQKNFSALNSGKNIFDLVIAKKLFTSIPAIKKRADAKRQPVKPEIHRHIRIGKTWCNQAEHRGTTIALISLATNLEVGFQLHDRG